MGLLHEFVEIGQRAVVGLDVAVVGNRVAVVVVLAGGDGHQPQAAHAQVVQVVQARREAAQVADAVAVAVLVAADEHFHERAVLPARGQRTARIGRGYAADVDGGQSWRGRGRRRGRHAAGTATTAAGREAGGCGARHEQGGQACETRARRIRQLIIAWDDATGLRRQRDGLIGGHGFEADGTAHAAGRWLERAAS